jgi:bloom syndrome protein
MQTENYQKQAIEVFMNQKRDIFVNLPTGYGKSLIYQALPLCFDVLNRRESKNTVVVISPLINLMKDQVRKVRNV